MRAPNPVAACLAIASAAALLASGSAAPTAEEVWVSMEHPRPGTVYVDDAPVAEPGGPRAVILGPLTVHVHWDCGDRSFESDVYLTSEDPPAPLPSTGSIKLEAKFLFSSGSVVFPHMVPEGGVFSSTLPVQPRFVFGEVEARVECFHQASTPDGPARILDGVATEIVEAAWVHNLGPP